MDAEKRARELYAAEKTHWAPVSAIVQHWGYSGTSSGGRTTLAALKKFGLLEDDGSGDERRGRLTDLAVELILNPEPDRARREAALLPRFHRQMWDEYGATLPSRATLRYQLIREHGFTESGAEEFVEEYEATMAFARLDSDYGARSEDETAPDATPSSVPAPLGPASAAPNDNRPSFAPTPPTTGMTIPVPLLGAEPVYVTGNFPLSEANWEQFVRVLEAMKPGLVMPSAGAERNLPPTASPVPEVSGEAEGGVQPQEYAPDDG